MYKLIRSVPALCALLLPLLGFTSDNGYKLRFHHPDSSGRAIILNLYQVGNLTCNGGLIESHKLRPGEGFQYDCSGPENICWAAANEGERENLRQGVVCARGDVRPHEI